MDGARIAQLLAHGAHAISAPEEDTAKEGDAFASEVGTYFYVGRISQMTDMLARTLIKEVHGVPCAQMAKITV